MTPQQPPSANQGHGEPQNEQTTPLYYRERGRNIEVQTAAGNWYRRQTIPPGSVRVPR